MSRQHDVHASEILAALEAGWSRVRDFHPDVPRVVLHLGAGEQGRKLVWGHFWEARWAVAGKDRAEVMISGESLARTARETFQTLLHEAAHGIAATRKIADTSRGGRYHNKRYKALAEEVGLECEEGAHGWNLTTIREETAARYAQQIAELDRAQRAAKNAHRRRSALVEVPRSGARTRRGGDAPRTTTRDSLTCGCMRRIAVAPGVAALGPILCGNCGEAFT